MQPPTPQVADPIPVRMCNELVFCPRLYHLEHVQGIFVESAATIEGSAQHRRAARKPLYRQRSDAPSPWSADLPRTLHFTSEAWGVSGQLDMIELTTGEVVPVEAKRGSAPSHDEHRWRGHDLRYRAWPADVAQLGLYMALLRDAGLPCSEGRIFYRRNRTLVTIAWSRELELVLREVVAQAQSVRSQVTAPPPLEDSPKCVGCSLHGVCLPDEYFALSRAREPEQPPIRRIIPGRDDRAILHVAVPGTTVRKQGESLFVCPRDDEDQRIPMKDIAHVAMFGRCHLTEPCLQHLLTRGISISHHTGAGYLVGFSSALGTRNIALRRAQFAAADNPTRSLEVARSLVYAKIRNQRTVIRRHRVTQDHEADDGIEFADALSRMQVALRNVKEADNIDALRGYEGEAAAQYFRVVPTLLPEGWQQDFKGRSRRPPRDRVNALLSFGYALLVKDAVAALTRVGLDPMLGYLHTMVPGRPALALDLMEPFRAAWVDTAILRMLKTGGVRREEFHMTLGGVRLSDKARGALIAAFERRANEQTTHPRFGYKMSYRRLLELEARVLGKWLVGEIDRFTPLWTR